MLTAQTLLPNALYAINLPTELEGKLPSEIAQLIENNAELDALRDQISSQLNTGKSSLLANLASTLSIPSEYQDTILNAFKTEIEKAYNEILGTDKEALKAEIEASIKAIATKFLNGEITEEQAKAEVATAIDTVVDTLEQKIYDTVYNALTSDGLTQGVYDTAYNALYTDSDANGKSDAYETAYDTVYNEFIANYQNCSALEGDEKAACDALNYAGLQTQIGATQLALDTASSALATTQTTFNAAVNAAQKALDDAKDLLSPAGKAKWIEEHKEDIAAGLISALNTAISAMEAVGVNDANATTWAATSYDQTCVTIPFVGRTCTNNYLNEKGLKITAAKAYVSAKTAKENAEQDAYATAESFYDAMANATDLKVLQDALTAANNSTIVSDAQAEVNRLQGELNTLNANLSSAESSVDSIAQNLADLAGKAADAAAKTAADVAGQTAVVIYQTSMSGVASAIVASFDALAQPIADQINAFADEIIEKIFNAKDFYDDNIKEPVACVLDDTTGLITAVKGLTININDYKAALQSSVALAQTISASLAKIDQAQDLETLINEIETIKTAVENSGLGVNDLKALKADLTEIRGVIANFLDCSQLPDILETVQSLDTVLKTLDTLIDTIETLTSLDPTKPSVALRAIANLETALADFLQDAQTAAEKVADIISDIEQNVNGLLAKLPIPLPALDIQNPLQPILDNAAAIDAIEQGLREVAQITNAVADVVEEIENFIKDTAIPTIENIIKFIEDTDREDVKDQLISKIETEIKNLIAQLPSESAVKAWLEEQLGKAGSLINDELEKVKEILKQELEKAYEATLEFLNDNKLDEPLFTATSCVQCDDESLFITTGNDFTFTASSYTQENEARGYLAVFTDENGRENVYVLPGTTLKDFPAITANTGTYTLEVRAIGVDKLLHSTDTYTFFDQLNIKDVKDLTVDKAKAQLTTVKSQVKALLANLQSQASTEWNNLPTPLKAMLTLLGSKIVEQLPDAVWNETILPALINFKDAIVEKADQTNGAIDELSNQFEDLKQQTKEWDDERHGLAGKNQALEDKILQLLASEHELAKAVVNSASSYTIIKVEQPETPTDVSTGVVLHDGDSTGVIIDLPDLPVGYFYTGDSISGTTIDTTVSATTTGSFRVYTIANNDCDPIYSDEATWKITVETEYLVTFISDGGTLKTEWVLSGNSATAPTNLTKSNYSLSWSPALAPITGTTTYTAVWIYNG
ncbi:MAG: hypothetical protein LBO09_02400 [Candidatus Peribacteria bacterium]|nr:hypothetical protein [Candidatus Peribacteria bacterium]